MAVCREVAWGRLVKQDRAPGVGVGQGHRTCGESARSESEQPKLEWCLRASEVIILQ